MKLAAKSSDGAEAEPPYPTPTPSQPKPMFFKVTPQATSTHPYPTPITYRITRSTVKVLDRSRNTWVASGFTKAESLRDLWAPEVLEPTTDPIS